MIDPQHWEDVLDKLREYATHYRGETAPDYWVPAVIQDLQGIGKFVPPYHVWLIMHELARMGVVVPGQRKFFNVPGAHFAGGSSRTIDLFNWPFFTITPFGLEYLTGTASGVDPGRPDAFVSSLQGKMPAIPQIALDYIRESAAAFSRGLYLGTTVLSGIAAEALLEYLYAALAQHMNPVKRTAYESKLQANKYSADKRFHIFKGNLQDHHNELDPELAFRLDTLLDPLARMLKVNRDDVAHHRTTRVNQDTAYATLAAFPALVDLAAELAQTLQSPCLIP